MPAVSPAEIRAAKAFLIKRKVGGVSPQKFAAGFI